MLAALAADAYSRKVGDASSRARFSLDSVGDVRKLLKDLQPCCQISG
jgi:hypothetical protein